MPRRLSMSGFIAAQASPSCRRSLLLVPRCQSQILRCKPCSSQSPLVRLRWYCTSHFARSDFTVPRFLRPRAPVSVFCPAPGGLTCDFQPTRPSLVSAAVFTRAREHLTGVRPDSCWPASIYFLFLFFFPTSSVGC